MARKRTKAAKQAQALLVWLETLELPARELHPHGQRAAMHFMADLLVG